MNFMIIPGLVSVTFKSLDTDTVIHLASKAGLCAIEWSEVWHLFPGDEKEAVNLGKRTRSSGMDVAALGSYYKLGCGMDFTTRLKSAAALGTDTIRIWAGEKPSSAVDPSLRRKMVEEARYVSDLASGYGIKIACEWHRNTLTDTNESGLSFLNEVDRDNFRTLWQPSLEMNEEERREGLVQIGKRLVNFHVYHWNGVERLALKDGKKQWLDYFSIPDPSICRYALLEFVQNDSMDQFMEDAECLRDMLFIR